MKGQSFQELSKVFFLKKIKFRYEQKSRGGASRKMKNIEGSGLLKMTSFEG